MSLPGFIETLLARGFRRVRERHPPPRQHHLLRPQLRGRAETPAPSCSTRRAPSPRHVEGLLGPLPGRAKSFGYFDQPSVLLVLSRLLLQGLLHRGGLARSGVPRSASTSPTTSSWAAPASCLALGGTNGALSSHQVHSRRLRTRLFIGLRSYISVRAGISGVTHDHRLHEWAPVHHCFVAYPELFAQVFVESARLFRPYSTSPQAPTFRRTSSRAPSG